MEKIVISINNEDLTVKYDYEKNNVILVGKGIDMVFKLHHFSLIYGTVISMQSHAIQESYDKKYVTQKT